MAMSPEERFSAFVRMVAKDFADLNARVARLEHEHAQLAGVSPAGTDAGEVVAYHPISGKPLTAQDVDQRMAMKLRFSEDDT